MIKVQYWSNINLIALHLENCFPYTQYLLSRTRKKSLVLEHLLQFLSRFLFANNKSGRLSRIVIVFRLLTKGSRLSHDYDPAGINPPFKNLSLPFLFHYLSYKLPQKMYVTYYVYKFYTNLLLSSNRIIMCVFKTRQQQYKNI